MIPAQIVEPAPAAAATPAFIALVQQCLLILYYSTQQLIQLTV
jgi:hypothetical protein